MSRQMQQAWNEQFCGTTHCIRVCQINRYTTNSNWNGRSFQNTVNRAVRSAEHHITCWEVLNRDLLLADHVNKCPHSDKSTNNNRRKDRWSHVLSSFACTFSVTHTHTHTHTHTSLSNITTCNYLTFGLCPSVLSRHVAVGWDTELQAGKSRVRFPMRSIT